MKKDVLLHFQNPVREMYFVSQSNVSVNSNFSNQYNKIKSVELKINNETLFHKKGKEVGYDHVLEKYMNSPIASDFGGPIEIEQRKFGPNVFGLHSFALNPMKPEPSGHINMSRIAHKVLSIEIEPLTGINENTLTTQVVTENSTVPFTLTNVTKVPFTETITTDTTTTTITPVTVTKNLITKKERVDTTVTTVTTITENIGLSFNPSVPQTVADVVSSTAVINTLDDPISTVIVSTVDGTPAVTTSVAVSPTVTVFQDPVSVPTSTTLGQKTINSTTIDSTTSKTFPLRTGTVPTNNSTQIELTVTQISTPNTTTPVRVEGDIDDLLQSAVDSTPVVISTGTNAIGTTNTDDTQNVSQGPSLSQPGSGAIFSLSDSIYMNQLGSGQVTTAQYATVSNPGGSLYTTPAYTPQYTNIRFDTETLPSSHGSCGAISRNGERIVSTHNQNFFSPAAVMYRHIEGIPDAFRPHSGYTSDTAVYNNVALQTVGESYLSEYFVSANDARHPTTWMPNPNNNTNNSLYFYESAKQTVTNFDGSVIAGSNYYQMSFNGAISPKEGIDIWTYTEKWDANRVGNGSWLKTDQLAKPSNMGSCHFGHSMSMNNIGNRIAVSGLVYTIDTETYTNPQDKPSLQPVTGTGSCNKVVFYDYSNGSWSSNQIQLSTQSGNYGIQVALTGDGNTLCVSMHGNDSGTIDCDGRLFLYTYSNSTWSLSSELDLPTPAPSSPSTSMFGRSIAISDDADTIIVGAPNWSGGRAFLYRITADTIHQIIKNTSSVTNFGHRVDISADGKRVLIGSRTGGVELWSTETTTPSFVSYHNDNGTNQITDVSVNEDGSKFVYSSPESERLYVNDARVTDTEISVTSGIIYNENYTYAPPVNNVQQTTTNRQQRIFKVPIQETETPTTTTVATTTPFDSVQEIEDLTSRTEVNVTTRNAITTGTNDTTTTTDGTRDQTEIETTQSLVTVPLVPEQEHDTRVYAVNYNVLTFRDGLAGLRF